MMPSLAYDFLFTQISSNAIYYNSSVARVGAMQWGICTPKPKLLSTR